MPGSSYCHRGAAGDDDDDDNDDDNDDDDDDDDDDGDDDLILLMRNIVIQSQLTYSNTYMHRLQKTALIKIHGACARRETDLRSKLISKRWMSKVRGASTYFGDTGDTDQRLIYGIFEGR